MATKKMQFRYFKSEEDLVANLGLIRRYFGPDATNIINRDFAFPNGVTGRELLEKYNRECEKVRRYDLKYKLTPRSLRKYLPATLVYTAEYETLFSLMELFKTNKITEREIDFVIRYSSHYFESYFDESLKQTETQDEME